MSQTLRKLIFGGLTAALLVGLINTARADWYVPGGWDVDPWNASSNPMTDLGNGLWEITLTGQTPNTRYEFKVLGEAGNWDSSATFPDESNSWGWTDENGEITLRLDENSLGNGYERDANRIIVVNDVTAWNVVGNFMDEAGGVGDWDNADPLFNMTDLGDGQYEYTAVISTPGTYEVKFVNTSTWDSIGIQGRTVNGWTWIFTTDVADQTVVFSLNTDWGAGLVTQVSCAYSGTLVEGFGEVNDFAATCGSDDVYWAAHGEVFAFQVSDPVSQFELVASAPTDFNGVTIGVDIEASKENDLGNLNVRALMYNFTTASYVALPGVLPLATTDDVANFALPSGLDPAEFIDPVNNDVKLLIQTIQTSGPPNLRTQLDEVLFKF